MNPTKILLFIQRPKSVKEQRIVEERSPSPIRRVQTEQEEIELIRGMQKNHSKIMNLNMKRVEHIQQVVQFWFQQNNIKAL